MEEERTGSAHRKQQKGEQTEDEPGGAAADGGTGLRDAEGVDERRGEGFDEAHGLILRGLWRAHVY